MAIGTVTVSVHRAGAGSAVGLSAYISRDQRTDAVTGEHFSFESRKDELIARGLVLPTDAPAWASDPEQLWTKATEKQLTKDRKTGEIRFKENAQVVKSFVFALPMELSREENVRLAQDAVKEWFADKGVAAEWALHDDGKPHLHVIVSTNELTADGFGKKARHMNPSFATKKGERFVSEEDHNNTRWRDFQDKWFADNGIDLKVDAYKLKPERTLGAAAHIANSELAKQNADELEAQKAAIEENPALILDKVTERSAKFDRRDVLKALKVHDIVGEQADKITDALLSSNDVLRLIDRDTKQATASYTTPKVRIQEQQTLDNVRTIASRPAPAVDAALVDRVSASLTMTKEQDAGLRRTVSRSFAAVQGDPGTGKSHTMKGIRQVKEQAGRVIGAAPTNTVAADMRKDGFKEADTLHALLGRIERGTITLDQKTTLIVDEAAMADTAILHRLTGACARSGASLYIVGDDKQLGSVVRGGIYTAIREEHGQSTLTDITRQKEGWQKDASKAFAAGNVKEAISAYEKHGCIAWNATQADAKDQLIKDWNGSDFIFASTNKSVNEINKLARDKRVQAGELGGSFLRTTTTRGEMTIAVGDRLQMHGNQKRDGIYNGTIGTVLGINRDRSMVIKFDGSDKATIIKPDFKDYGYGYAGTVYRGQGKTMRGAVALHDSAHAWNRESGLVGMTRHKEDFKLYVSLDIARDQTALATQMRRSACKSASVAWDAVPAADYAAQQAAEARRIAQERAAAVEAAKVAAEQKAAQERAAAAFAARSKELEGMIRDGRRIEVADRVYSVAGMTDRPDILVELQQRPELGVVVVDALGAQAQRDEAARIAAAEAARIAAQQAQIAEAARVGIGTFKERFEAEKAARAAAEAERQRLAELERQRAAAAARSRSRGHGWSM